MDNVLSLTLDEMIRARDVTVEPDVDRLKERVRAADAGLDVPPDEAGNSGESADHPGTGKSADHPETEGESAGQQKTEAESAIYLPPFFFAETGCVRRLCRIFRNREGITSEAGWTGSPGGK